LKQLAYSARIDDLLRGRQPSLSSSDSRPSAGVSEIVTSIWDRDGVLVLVAPSAGFPVPATEGYSSVTQNGREWRICARLGNPCVAGRTRSTSSSKF
jgi:hypothetical protein